MSRLKLKSFSQTIIPMETKGNSSIFSDRKTNKKTVASSATARANGKSTASYAIVMKPNGKSAVSSAILMKPNASTAPSSAHGDQVMFFRDVSLSPTEADLRFRLIHLWEARNPSTKTLIGQEMILIDEEVRMWIFYYSFSFFNNARYIVRFRLIDNYKCLIGNCYSGFCTCWAGWDVWTGTRFCL